MFRYSFKRIIYICIFIVQLNIESLGIDKHEAKIKIKSLSKIKIQLVKNTALCEVYQTKKKLILIFKKIKL